jgi:predicted nucleic acid-binding protein
MVAVFAVDTSCMVAAVCTWHEHHAAAASEIERRLGRRERMVIPAPALVEAYAVLTRLPAPHRLAPADAWVLVRANFVERRHVVALTNRLYADVLHTLVQQAVSGGRAYDAVIAACARHARADVLLTFNIRHFDPSPKGVRVVEPAQAA